MADPERISLTTPDSLEASKTKLEAYLGESVPGQAKFMAFWDLVELEAVEIDLAGAETVNPHFIGLQINRNLVALARDRINTRSSEVPNYYASLLGLKEILDEIMHATASAQPLSYLRALRDHIAKG